MQKVKKDKIKSVLKAYFRLRKKYPNQLRPAVEADHLSPYKNIPVTGLD